MSLAVLLVVGSSLVLVAALLLPFSKHVRRDGPLDPTSAAKALLGEEPPDFPEPEPPPDRHRDYDPGELRALRNLGSRSTGGRSKRR